MITVHHLEDSRSQRVLWLLEELQLPYRVQRTARDSTTMLAPPELKRVHPLGKSPVITDGATTVAETGAIVEYLLDRAGSGVAAPLRPQPGSPEMLRYRYWLHFAEGSAMPPLVMTLVFDRIAKAPMPFFAKPIAKAIVKQVMTGFLTPNLESQLDFMEAELTQHEWFAGAAFTAADVMMSFPLEAAAQRAGLNRGRPKLHALLKRLQARPAYRKALEKGGPYAFAN
jgi:glutathione S-transferase